MKLFLKAIALAAKDPSFKGNPRQELNRLIDVAESSGLVVWHDDFCFKSSFWDWGNRETGNINWGGYGSSYKPANESYFKFQYPGDTVTSTGSYGGDKLVSRKGGKPLDAVKALILPEADADGTMQALLAKAGANPVFVADKGLKADAIVDLLTEKKCNFLLTADEIPAGLTEALDRAAADEDYYFTLPSDRLRPLLEKPKRAPVVRGQNAPKAPPAFADKDDAKAFTKLKQLLTSQKFEEIDQAITLLPGLPGACDKLLEGISLSEGITAWTNNGKAWTANYDRPGRWGENHAKLPCDLTEQGQVIRLAEIPKNDLFNTAEAKRYALFSVINAAPEDCAPAKAIREGLIALHWKEAKLPPLSNFTALRHLYLEGCNGHESIGEITSLVFASSGYKQGLVPDWILPLKSLKRLDVSASIDREKRNGFLKAAAFPALEELVWSDFDQKSPCIPSTIRDVWINSVRIPHSRLEEVLRFPRFRASSISIETDQEDAGNNTKAARKEPEFQPVKIVPVKDRGEALPAKELASLKKLLRDDAPETVMQGLKILRASTPATIDALLDKSTVQWDDRNMGHFGGYVSGRLGGPLFDSLKRNELGEAVRMNLLSLAAPGFRPVDAIRSEIRDIDLPPAIVPIDVSGFNGIMRLKITIDPSKPTENWITGMEKLTTLQKLDLKFSGGGSFENLERALPLGFTPPGNVTEMDIDFSYREVKVNPDFFSVSSNLRKLKIEQFGPLSNLALLKGLDPTKLEELILDYDSSNDQLPPEDLTSLAPFVNLVSISGSRSCLKSLKGVSVFKNLRSINFESDGLEDVAELAQVTSLESLKLGDHSGHGLSMGDLAILPRLGFLNYGSHRVTDPRTLMKFRPGTSIRIKSLDSQNQ
jgi:hypothetical protein